MSKGHCIVVILTVNCDECDRKDFIRKKSAINESGQPKRNVKVVRRLRRMINGQNLMLQAKCQRYRDK